MKRKSAFFAALEEIQQQQQPVQESSSDTAETASPPPTSPKGRAQQEAGAPSPEDEGRSGRKAYFEKASIYLDEIHTYKLQDIVIDYRRTRKQKMNRQEIIRRLLERLSKDEIMHIISD